MTWSKRGLTVGYILASLVTLYPVCGYADSPIVCSELDIRSPWSEDYPMCWMTKGAIIHTMWPEGTTYDHLSTDESFANDGKFLKALDAILLPRTTSVCESEAGCYGEIFAKNMFLSISQEQAWIINEGVEDIQQILGNFSNVSINGNFTYDFLNNIASVARKQRFSYASDPDNTDPLAIVNPLPIAQATISPFANSTLNVASNADFVAYRQLTDLLATTSFLKQMSMSCRDDYLPFIPSSELKRLAERSDEEVAQQDKSTKQDDKSPKFIVSVNGTEDEDIKTGCSMLSANKKPEVIWNGMRTVQKYLTIFSDKITQLTQNPELSDYTNGHEFKTYHAASKCVISLLQGLYARNGSWINYLDDTNTFSGWRGTDDNWWNSQGVDVSNADANVCKAFLNLYVDSRGQNANVFKIDAERILDNNISMFAVPSRDPVPDMFTALSFLLDALQNQLTAQVSVLGIKSGNKFMEGLPETNAFKTSLLDNYYMPFPQLSYLSDDTRDNTKQADDSSCAYKPLTEALTVNDTEDTYEKMQRVLIANIMKYEKSPPVVGFDTSLSMPGSIFVDNGIGRPKLEVGGEKQVVFLKNGRFMRYAEFCKFATPDASGVLHSPLQNTDKPPQRVKLIPKYYKTVRKAQQAVKNQFAKEYNAYMRSTLRFSLRQAMLTYQLKSSLLKTIQFTKAPTTTGMCYFSLAEQMRLNSRWRMRNDKQILTDLLGLNTQQPDGTVVPMTPDRYNILPYRAFLDNEESKLGSREIDFVRDMAYQMSVSLYQKYLEYKLKESLILYFSVQLSTSRDGPLEKVGYMVKENYLTPVSNLYRGNGASSSVLDGETKTEEPDPISEEEREIMNGTPEQRGLTDVCIENW